MIRFGPPYSAPILETNNLCVEYRGIGLRSKSVQALECVSLSLAESSTLGIVGPSGSGKTTLALACAGLLRPQKGTVKHLGMDAFRRSWFFSLNVRPSPIQMVFQNPFASLNPRRTVGAWLSAVVQHCSGSSIDKPSPSFYLELVGLSHNILKALPGEMSGGECQRACIAACVASGAQAIILDEPLSMLDPISAESVITTLRNLQSSIGVSYLAVSHDLRFVDLLCERVMVLSCGRVVGEGATWEVFGNPKDSVTQALVAASI